MSFAFEKLKGLNREALLAAIQPVLAAHRVAGVELIWRTDNRGWVLYLTVERPEHRTGAGVTLDECSELSRDVSAALDLANVIEPAYRLEVGTPGLERQLYRLSDYERFAGESARLKLRQALDGQWSLRGRLLGLEEESRVQLETDNGVYSVDFNDIDTAQLVFEGWGKAPKPSGRRKSHAPKRGKDQQR
jgi:ribosome maturation factor RimP